MIIPGVEDTGGGISPPGRVIVVTVPLDGLLDGLSRGDELEVRQVFPQLGVTRSLLELTVSFVRQELHFAFKVKSLEETLQEKEAELTTAKAASARETLAQIEAEKKAAKRAVKNGNPTNPEVAKITEWNRRSREKGRTTTTTRPVVRPQAAADSSVPLDENEDLDIQDDQPAVAGDQNMKKRLFTCVSDSEDADNAGSPKYVWVEGRLETRTTSAKDEKGHTYKCTLLPGGLKKVKQIEKKLKVMSKDLKRFSRTLRKFTAPISDVT